MKRERGFTLIEVVVVIAIVGILSATALPFYATYRMRTYGSEARVMIKQILEAEITYYLENDDFFPPLGLYPADTIQVFHNDPPNKPEISDVTNALKIVIPVGHNLEFTIQRMAPDSCSVTIGSHQNAFPLFGNGAQNIMGTIDRNGNIVTVYF